MYEQIQSEASSKLFSGWPILVIGTISILQYPLTCVSKTTLPIFLQKHQGSLILLDAISIKLCIKFA